MSRDDVGKAGYDNSPLYYDDKSVPEETRLSLAYGEATKYLQAAIPAGTTVDTSQYDLATQVAGDTMDAHGDTLISTFKAGATANIPTDSAFQFTSDQCKNHYLASYAQASSNLGAYITGYARSQLQIGALSQADFDTGVDVRLRKFYEIINLGRSGQLKAVVDPVGYAASKNVTSGAITVAAGQTALSSGVATSGLGVTDQTIALLLIITFGLAGALVAGGMYLEKARLADQLNAFDLCKQAIASNNPQAAQICQNMGDLVAKLQKQEQEASLLTQLIPVETQKKIAAYGMLGIGLFLAVYFSPTILASLGKAGDVWARRKARKLKELTEAYPELPMIGEE